MIWILAEAQARATLPAGIVPRHFLYMPTVPSELSVFVDESGSFDSSCEPSRFYLITLVLHDQREDISGQLAELDRQLELLKVPGLCLHAGPLIRREEEFRSFDIVLRRRLFGRMIEFARHVPVKSVTFSVDKKFCSNPDAMMKALTQQMQKFLSDHTELVRGYDSVKIYYDDGQAQVKSILKNAFAGLNAVFVANVIPDNYRLFQVADLICTVQLIKTKLDLGVHLTHSEEYFFDKIRDLKKNVIKPLSRLHFAMAMIVSALANM